MNIIDLQVYKQHKLAEKKRLEKVATEEENQNIIDCLGMGAPGLHDLVQSYELNDERKYSLGSYLEMVQDVFKKEPRDLFYDAARMDPDAFYNKHELNWWITIDEMLTFLAMMKESNYSTYARIVIETMEDI
jgi:hypothetical protein